MSARTSYRQSSQLHRSGKQKAKFRTTLRVPQAKQEVSIMAVKPVPDGYHSVTPYLTVRSATKIIEFLKQAFGAAVA